MTRTQLWSLYSKLQNSNLLYNKIFSEYLVCVYSEKTNNDLFYIFNDYKKDTIKKVLHIGVFSSISTMFESVQTSYITDENELGHELLTAVLCLEENIQEKILNLYLQNTYEDLLWTLNTCVKKCEEERLEEEEFERKEQEKAKKLLDEYEENDDGLDNIF